MDFPLFHADLIGNRAIIAVIATLHVLINHGLAVGLVPLVATLEWHGYKTGGARWDKLAYKVMFFAFLVTTTVGAMTGVGIWLSASLINPAAIGSLIRVFFWAWVVEWIVFITEVSLIIVYFLTWKKWTTDAQKRRHIRLGFAVGVFSWITMAIIVSILGFMMDPGNWLTERSLFAGLTNPMYLPQLAFRTPLALAMAGVIAIFLATCFIRKDDPFRAEAIRALSLWPLFWAPLILLGGWWYASAIPDALAENIGVGLLTMQFETWQDDFIKIIIGTVALLYLIAQISVARPRWLPSPTYLVALIAIAWLTGHFERVREFIRKPYVIGQYMYANGLRVGDYPLYQRDGVLPHSIYSYPLSAAESHGLETDRVAEVQRGKDVFMLTCSRCHTGSGVNSVVARFSALLGDEPWTGAMVADYSGSMHDARPYMPPFPGTRDELLALGMYVVQLRATGSHASGVQESGVSINPQVARESAPSPGALAKRGVNQ